MFRISSALGFSPLASVVSGASSAAGAGAGASALGSLVISGAFASATGYEGAVVAGFALLFAGDLASNGL